MNQMHQRICSSEKWALKTRELLLPWALHGVELGTDVLEIGPGYGANLRVLVEQVPHLTAVEVDAGTARLLDVAWGERARIVHADGADMPLPDASYDSVVCFTMLHHVPSAELQDRIFAEAFRVLRPGGTFAGSDSQSSLRFRLVHFRDTMVVLDPDTLPERLRAAGFTGVELEHTPRVRLRFTATKG